MGDAVFSSGENPLSLDIFFIHLKLHFSSLAPQIGSKDYLRGQKVLVKPM